MNAQRSALDSASLLVLLPLSAVLLVQGTGGEPVSGVQGLVLLFLVFLFLRAGILVILSFTEAYFERPLTPLESYPLVSVIVPCFNEEKVIQASIRSLLKLDYPNLEIIVVDDGSSDMTFAAAKRIEPEGNIRVIHQANQGKARALNHGIHEAQGDFVLCVDADGVIEPDAIRNGLPLLQSDPRIASVAGNVRISNVGRNGNWLTAFQRLEYLSGLNFQKPAQSFLSAVTVIPGPVGLFRRSILLEMGGYRSDTFAEDADLTIRLLMAGFRVVYQRRMIAITEAPEDFTSLVKQRYRWNRGTLQAIKAALSDPSKPWRRPRAACILAYLGLEALVVPLANLCLGLYFLEEAFSGRASLSLNHYFLPFIMLELVITSYSILQEEGKTRLLFLSCINRFSYGLATEVLRLFSLLDEVLGLPMTWNKLQRKGQ